MAHYPPPPHVMDTARCVITACFLHDEQAVRHLVEGEEDPAYLIMALGHLSCQTIARVARNKGEDPFELWQQGLQRLAQQRSAD